MKSALSRQAAVALIGPRQVGKTTLALALAAEQPALYMDLESTADRHKLSDPALFLQAHADTLVILDEIHRAPELFATLRGLIDAGRRRGKRTGRFLLLGSAAIPLLKQSSESLAGRIEFVELTPLTIDEVSTPDTPAATTLDRLWVRGGFPDSFLAATDHDSFRLRLSFVRTYLERDVPQFGPRIPAETLARLWTMLAHNQGSVLNASRLAAGLALSAPTVASYVGLLTDLLLVRRLPPYVANVGKRLVKSPRVYVRDSGLVHALLGIDAAEGLLGHPVCGPSWEGFVIEQLLAAAPPQARASFYRTAAGAEIDLVLELGGAHGCWAIEIKRALAPKLERGFYHALEDIRPSRTFVVTPGADRYAISHAECIGVAALQMQLRTLSAPDTMPV